MCRYFASELRILRKTQAEFETVVLCQYNKLEFEPSRDRLVIWYVHGMKQLGICNCCFIGLSAMNS